MRRWRNQRLTFNGPYRTQESLFQSLCALLMSIFTQLLSTSADHPALPCAAAFPPFVPTGPVFQNASDFLPIAVIHQHLKTITWISTSCCY